MKLSELLQSLENLESLHFELPSGNHVPKHFHVTEIGLIDKSFIDCGGNVRHEKKVNLQLWSSYDYDHRLEAGKLRRILSKAISILNLPNVEIEVDYQGITLQKFALEFENDHFILVPIHTTCLANEECGIPILDMKSKKDDKSTNCIPGSLCC